MLEPDEILEAAQRLFGRYGLKKVTTDDIAREAHVSKATIYKLYRNKQQILKAVVQREMAELLGRITGAVDAEAMVEGKLRAHLITKITTVHELINLHQVTSESLAEHWEYASTLREQFVRAESGIIREILSRGVEVGELDVVDVEVTAHFMAVSLGSLESPWAIEGLDLTIPEQVDAMLRILMNGLRRRD